MRRQRWLVVVFLAVATVAAARQRDANPKPKNGLWLDQKKSLWYLLHVPKPYDPKVRYPLLVATAWRGDRAAESYKHWVEAARLDQIFLATLSSPRSYKGDKAGDLLKMVEKICKEYDNIDRKHLVLVGVDNGATDALKFLATYPHVFAAALVLNPNSYPDLSKIKPKGPRLVGSTPKVVLSYDPKNKEQFPKIRGVISQLGRRRLSVHREGIVPEGAGVPAEDEKKLALKVLRSTYSSERRTMLAAAWQGEADKIRKQKEEERKKLAAARAEIEGKPKPGTEPTRVGKQPEDPDSLWLKANALQNQKKDYAAAIEVYEKLLEVAPKSDYATEARKRIAALRNDPSVRQAIADQDAGGECRKWLSLAANYARAGMNDKALVYYNKVIETHPDSSFATTAREAVKKLKGQ